MMIATENELKVYVNGMDMDILNRIKDAYTNYMMRDEKIPFTLIGRGWFGEVYRFHNYAIKIIRKDRKDSMSGLKDIHMLKELSFLDFIPKIYASINNDCVIMELIEGKTIAEYIGGDNTLNLDMSILYELEDCLRKVYQSGFIPSDCHSENIMIDNNGHIKLIDVANYRAYAYTDSDLMEINLSQNTGLYFAGDELKAYLQSFD